MNDFDYDVLQKKRVAYGAKHKVRAKRGCHLPSDNLTAAQKRRLNGEMKTYNMNAPMSWADFKEMPDDLKVQYINHLFVDYQATQKMVADMFGVSAPYICGWMKRAKTIGVMAKPGHGNRSVEALLKWKCFIDGGLVEEEDPDFTPVPAEGSEIEKLPVEQEIPIEKSDLTRPLMKCLSMEFEDVHNWLDLYSRVMDFPTAPGAKVKVTLEW